MLCMFGIIRYEDGNKTVRNTSFCRVYDPPTAASHVLASMTTTQSESTRISAALACRLNLVSRGANVTRTGRKEQRVIGRVG
jgi:hypothetical protein